jgi:alkaline phosphatase
MRPLLAAAAVLCAVTAAGAQTIYPIDRAEILTGTQFDFKVEFPQLAAADKVKVTVNEVEQTAVFGESAAFIEREDGKDQSALLLRDVTLSKPGPYKVRATDGVNTREVTWTVYETGPRHAKNVILFIGDGMSPAHRVAARLLSKGMAEARHSASLRSMTCRTLRWLRPPAAIPSSRIQPIQ